MDRARPINPVAPKVLRDATRHRLIQKCVWLGAGRGARGLSRLPWIYDEMFRERQTGGVPVGIGVEERVALATARLAIRTGRRWVLKPH